MKRNVKETYLFVYFFISKLYSRYKLLNTGPDWLNGRYNIVHYVFSYVRTVAVWNHNLK